MHVYTSTLLMGAGQLSQRMQIPGNMWVEVWQSAKPIPARRQRRLFDDTKEAEKVHVRSSILLSSCHNAPLYERMFGLSYVAVTLRAHLRHTKTPVMRSFMILWTVCCPHKFCSRSGLKCKKKNCDDVTDTHMFIRTTNRCCTGWRRWRRVTWRRG